MRALWPSTLSIALGALAGCSANVGVSTDVVDAEAIQPATGIVVVKHAHGEATQVVAQFVQMKTGVVDEPTLRHLGAAIDLPALGSCNWIERARDGAEPLRPVRLTDVGAVSLEWKGGRIPLVARQVPDVADLVSGAVYSAQDEAAVAEDSPVTLRGGAADLEVSPFAVTALAPPVFQEIAVAFGATAADVTWDESLASEDVVVLEMGRDRSAPLVRCSFADRGHAQVPLWAWAGLEEGVLTAHRIRREGFRVRGLDSGEIRFDYARSVAFRR